MKSVWIKVTSIVLPVVGLALALTRPDQDRSSVQFVVTEDARSKQEAVRSSVWEKARPSIVVTESSASVSGQPVYMQPAVAPDLRVDVLSATSPQFFSDEAPRATAAKPVRSTDFPASIQSIHPVVRVTKAAPTGATFSIPSPRVNAAAVSIPAVLAPDTSTLDLDPEHQQAIDTLADELVAQVGDAATNLSTFNSQRVRLAMSEADARYRMLYGHQAYVRLQLLASQQLAQ